MASPDDVRAALERVLAAEPFLNAGRLSRLLRYLVERTIAGEGDQLKEYVLGVEVFDRGSSYDPRLDSIVRVEVRRLRSKLEEYYRSHGATDALIITIPRGSYAPVFTAAVPPPVAAIAADPAAKSRVRWLVIAGCAAAVLALMVMTAARSQPQVTVPAQASSTPSIVVLPFEHYSTSTTDAALAARITDGVTTELARLGTVSVASRTSASRYTSSARSARAIAESLGVDYVMEASAISRPDGLRITARLVDGTADRKVWVGEYDSHADRVDDLARQIAREACAAALKLYSNR